MLRDIYTQCLLSQWRWSERSYFNPRLQPGQILLEMKIFDRYGKLVYNNENLKKGWDGRYGTEDAKNDVSNT